MRIELIEYVQNKNDGYLIKTNNGKYILTEKEFINSQNGNYDNTREVYKNFLLLSENDIVKSIHKMWDIGSLFSDLYEEYLLEDIDEKLKAQLLSDIKEICIELEYNPPSWWLNKRNHLKGDFIEDYDLGAFSGKYDLSEKQIPMKPCSCCGSEMFAGNYSISCSNNDCILSYGINYTDDDNINKDE